MSIINIRGIVIAAIAAVGALSLSACAGSSNDPMNLAIAKTQFNGFSHADMAQSAVFQHPRFNGGVVPPEAVKEIKTVLSRSCNDQGHAQLAGLVQSGGTGAAPGAVVNAVTLHTDAGLFGYAKAATKLYTHEGLINGAISGAYGNANNAAQSSASAIGGCVRDEWAVSKSFEPDPGQPSFTARKYKGTIVETVLAGKSLTDTPPATRSNYEAYRPVP